MMRFASLGSGSDGNGLLVEAGATRILADCGFTLSNTIERLARRGVEPASINALVVTHEHDDHIGGVARFARKFGVPVWLTHGTLQASAGAFAEHAALEIFDCHQRFAIGAIEIEPYTVPHDAREPAQFVFGDGAARLGLLTDAGSLTVHMQEVLSGLDALVLECNHDLDMLKNGPYPERLKQRIAGNFGHLDNATAGRLLASVDCSRLKHVIAAHLSAQNNTPDVGARGAGWRAQLRSAMGGRGDPAGWLRLARDRLSWIRLKKTGPQAGFLLPKLEATTSSSRPWPCPWLCLVHRAFCHVTGFIFRHVHCATCVASARRAGAAGAAAAGAAASLAGSLLAASGAGAGAGAGAGVAAGAGAALGAGAGAGFSPQAVRPAANIAAIKIERFIVFPLTKS